LRIFIAHLECASSFGVEKLAHLGKLMDNMQSLASRFDSLPMENRLRTLIALLQLASRAPRRSGAKVAHLDISTTLFYLRHNIDNASYVNPNLLHSRE
jgi:hypothetical protein